MARNGRKERLTTAQARRMALAAAGLTRPRPAVTPNLGHVTRVIRELRVLQIDSVSVVERAHLLTLFSRLGPFDVALLDRALSERRVFEYWARMASFAPIEDFPLYRHRMDQRAHGTWARDLHQRAPGYIEEVLREVAERGPLTVGDLERPGERRGPWWGWADGKIALEYLFAVGRVTVSHRRNFVRYYDLTERVIPAEHLDGPMPSAEVAQRRLLLQAARAVGVGTARDIIDYHWIPVKQGRPVLAGLVAEGLLEEVEVDGWAAPAYVHPEARRPRAVDLRALLNPFDPYMWNRDRVERLHGFEYRIEIYVPAPKRVHGYYVLPFLLGDDLQARVDLKADRPGGRLTVLAAYLEPGRDPDRVARELRAELRELARWLGLEVEVGAPRGDLGPALRSAMADGDGD
jgi:uncharacterized protein YcaQ